LTYLDIQEGDYVSSLSGARAYNHYQVMGKAAYKDAARVPPWPPLRLRPSRKVYSFPFRLGLRPVRTFEEPLVPPQNEYVGENLLLRAGYPKTHFQADQTTLQNVSEIGFLSSGAAEHLEVGNAETFVPRVIPDKAKAKVPEIFSIRELIVHALLHTHLSKTDYLDRLLRNASIIGINASRMEIQGEKAFPEGHVDMLIKGSNADRRRAKGRHSG
jgi:hypothetical protein